MMVFWERNSGASVYLLNGLSLSFFAFINIISFDKDPQTAWPNIIIREIREGGSLGRGLTSTLKV